MVDMIHRNSPTSATQKRLLSEFEVGFEVELYSEAQAQTQKTETGTA